jgi:hypothetical protein
MKIGKALRTQASSLYSATPIGAPMHPAPIGVADRTRKKNYWRTVPGHHCLLAEGDIGAPIYWRTDPPVHRVDRVLGFLSSRLNWDPNHLTRRWVCPPLWCQGGTHLLAGEGVGGVPILANRQKKFKKRRTEHFGAPRLFSSQSPINWALHTGNGNTLKKKRRQH